MKIVKKIRNKDKKIALKLKKKYIWMGYVNFWQYYWFHMNRPFYLNLVNKYFLKIFYQTFFKITKLQTGRTVAEMDRRRFRSDKETEWMDSRIRKYKIFSK